jgi:hypothetical protein
LFGKRQKFNFPDSVITFAATVLKPFNINPEFNGSLVLSKASTALAVSL